MKSNYCLKAIVSPRVSKTLAGILLAIIMSLMSYPVYVRASEPTNPSDIGTSSKRIYVGPRQNISPETPSDEGFRSFAVVVPTIISRSGQPSITDFQWIKDHGWKSDINLRSEADDSKIEGFNELGLNYLHLKIVDLSVPSEEQAQQYLSFITNPLNQPAIVHCKAGIGRTGIMTALYRYSVQGWSMDDAISESRLFMGGVNQVQEKWLRNWAKTHEPGTFLNKSAPMKSE
jgi:protein tyrosine/serine phosphatase